ncbi:Regulator of microtubule dynamics protein 3 [Blattella germanica]|nr:Regulator of microtubule dynamics protein 3 [Blattella germanica]
MNADFLRYRGLLAAAVGAGVVLGAAGIFLYHQLYAEKRRMLLQRDLARLDMTVAEMRNELDALRRTARSRRPVSRRANTKSASTAGSELDTDIDLYSAIGTDDDDEFFDFSDEDDVMVSSVNLLEASETESNPQLVKLLDEVDRLLEGPADEKQLAYSMLLEHEDEYSGYVSVLWRLAKASHKMAIIYGAEGDSERKKEFILQGLQYAQRALELDESDAEAHKWFAVTVGSRGEFLGTREKIEDGYVFKDHVDKALKLRPEDPSLHHLRGRFKYERKLAGTFLAEPPTATYPEAIEDFLMAENLSPKPWKENRLLIAKCHINQGNYTEGVVWLDRAAEVPVISPDEGAAEKEIQSLLQKYESYRK